MASKEKGGGSITGPASKSTFAPGTFQQWSAHHQRGEAGGVRIGCGTVTGDLAIAQHGEAIGEVDDLLEEVGDVEDRQAFVATSSQEVEEA